MTDAATLAAVVAAATAAVDASVDLVVNSEAIDQAVNVTITPPTIVDMTTTATTPQDHDMDGSTTAAVSANGAIDIPFLEDADIAATAAAVAMNSVTTTAVAAVAANTTDHHNTVTTGKKKAAKRKRPVDKQKPNNNETTINTNNNNNNDPFDDYNDIDNEEDDYDEHGNAISGSHKKTQIRYDPSIPMEKEQLAAWRREARRVRNRESAAASRQRIRGRITELEDELDGWKAKYQAAMTTLARIQQQQEAPLLPLQQNGNPAHDDDTNDRQHTDRSEMNGTTKI